MNPSSHSYRLINPARRLSGKLRIPGDKSISHRSLLLGAISNGMTQIHGILESEDVISTARCLRQLGVHIERMRDTTIVYGKGLEGLTPPQNTLDCGNSGTTIRLLMGILSSRQFISRFTGDQSLQKRPMRRVADPLRKMGASIQLHQDNFPPFMIEGRALRAIEYELPVASAQIKTAVIFAALAAEGTTVLSGKINSRDHTERMLADFGGTIQSDRQTIHIPGCQKLKGSLVHVPGDPSTAAFWIAAACLVPQSEIKLENVSLNPTRLGFVRVLERMGADIELEVTSSSHEPVGNIYVKSSHLKGVEIYPEEIPTLIDEIPLLAVIATQAEGQTEVRGAEELRIKESDRLEAIAINLRAMGATVDVRPDGFLIQGQQVLSGGTIQTYDDHRIAMAFSIAGLVARGSTSILNPQCAAVSYPEFYTAMEGLIR